MVKQNSKHSFLYFHMGPGFHSQIEAQVFSSRYPHVAFLNQPSDVTFSELRDWAVEQIRQHAHACGHKVTLLGHSFGGQVITAALQSAGQHVAEIRLLNSSFCSFNCFINIHNTLEPQSPLDPVVWRNKSPADKMNQVFHVAQLPGFADSYWIDPKAQAAYNKLAAAYPALDLNTFVKVFTSYLNSGDPTNGTVWQGPVKIFYSLQDKLIQHLDVITDWKKTFPNAQLQQITGGHYTLFEVPDFDRIFFAP